MEHMGMGFGLGFLNLIGTILFWVAAFWTVRFFIRGGFRGDYRSRLPKWRGEWSKGRGGGRNTGGGIQKVVFARGWLEHIIKTCWRIETCCQTQSPSTD